MENNDGKNKMELVAEKVYGIKELLIFLLTSKAFQLVFVFLIIFVFLESFLSDYLISERGIGKGDSTASLVMVYMAVFMIIVNSFVLFAGEIISVRKTKTTIWAKILLPFIAIILAFVVTFIIDTIMPCKIFYTLAKALYII